MRKALLALAVTVLAGTFAPYSTVCAAEAVKYEVYFVNLQRALNESNKGKQARALIDAKIAKAKQKLKQMEAEVRKLQKELQSPVLSQTEKDKKELELQKKLSQIRQFKQETQLEIAQLEQKYTNQILKELVELIRKYRKEKNIPVILDPREAGVIAADPKLDLTDTIIKLYNQQAGR
ncbi:OmpH family outer membrane protein [Thermovibrio ammonificans]|jgi:outer membrane protein|uniref:Outer membrane chaperone Skp (OmpH) n=1 Tax=Thermovibrio ammonificans (strain DSM 15698 / JCM 12110 / HB-1) TaxID=648996 RepID=E8T383_THEA1|nr:OmpH family outer membrane protein [Thermovibrio ammonificans]ADU97215.1 outer membrane chaperone Skp (OmpH) [Thermovibrio ammonificans HB-1]